MCASARRAATPSSAGCGRSRSAAASVSSDDSPSKDVRPWDAALLSPAKTRRALERCGEDDDDSGGDHVVPAAGVVGGGGGRGRPCGCRSRDVAPSSSAERRRLSLVSRPSLTLTTTAKEPAFGAALLWAKSSFSQPAAPSTSSRRRSRPHSDDSDDLGRQRERRRVLPLSRRPARRDGATAEVQVRALVAPSLERDASADLERAVGLAGPRGAMWSSRVV